MNQIEQSIKDLEEKIKRENLNLQRLKEARRKSRKSEEEDEIISIPFTSRGAVKLALGDFFTATDESVHTLLDKCSCNYIDFRFEWDGEN